MTDLLVAVPHILFQLARGVAIGVVLMLPCLALLWWHHRRDGRRREVQAQVREIEEQIRLETLPDWQREVILETRQRQQEIARKGRRRAGPADGGGRWLTTPWTPWNARCANSRVRSPI